MKDKLRPAIPGITFDSGAVVEVPVERDNGQRALEAWKAWWQSTEYIGERYHLPKGIPSYCDAEGNLICFFCEEILNLPTISNRRPIDCHREDCPYLIVKAIAEEEGW